MNAFVSERPSDHVWGLVCGLPRALRTSRYLVMLKAFIDDSRMGQPPVYVLGGYVAPADVWAEFSDDWDDVLRMRPRIQYFKFSEAMNLSGEFGGISEQSRDEKMTLLIRVIEEHKLFGAASIIPHRIFDLYFGSSANAELRNPYFPSLYGLVARILHANKQRGLEDRLELFFDYQPGNANQMETVRRGWEQFRETMPEEFRPLVQSHPPTFLDDRDVVGLQAADLKAGWVRSLWESRLTRSKPPYWPWGNRDLDIPYALIEWDDQLARGIYQEIFGHAPSMYTFGTKRGVVTLGS